MKSAAKKFKPSAASIEARRQLMIRSREAKELSIKLLAMTGELRSVNEILLDFYKEETGAKDFRRFDEWKEAGFMVKKGESAYRVWGSPKQFTKTQEMQDVTTGNTDNIESKFEFWPMCCIFNENQVEPFSSTTAAPAPIAAAELPRLCIGEKVETVYRTRQTGHFGEYLGASYGAHLVRVDGITFEIIANGDKSAPHYWTVINHNTGKEAHQNDRLCLIEAVREANTPAPETQKNKVRVSDFRIATESLERSYNVDRQACVGTAENLENMRKLFFWLRNLEAMTCARANADDLANRDSIVSTVRAFLGMDNTNPEPVPPTPTPTKKAPAPKPAQPKAPAGDAKKAAKLRTLAEKQTDKINHYFADRLQNTPKRAAQAAHARLDGERLKRAQAALFALADLVEQGKAPEALSHVNSTKAMLDLVRGKTENVRNGFHGYSVDAGQPHNDTPEVLAAWALLNPKSQAEKDADALRVKEAGLINADIAGFFPSPKDVVSLIIDRAQLEDGLSVVDTSAGTGAILDGVKEQFGIIGAAYERNHTLNEILTLKGYNPIQGDSLEVEPAQQFDRVLINPPFENQQDIDHIRHGFDHFLKAGGRMVAICFPSVFTSQTKKAQAFREWFESLGGTVEDIEAGAFKASGTMISTKLITIDKPDNTGTDDDTEETKENPFTRSDYEQRQNAKIYNFSERAERAHKEADRLYNRTRELGSVIPLGQPILLGHHSEKRDRAFRARLDGAFRKSFALTDKGNYYAQRAATVGAGGIATDDPNSIEKLQAKIDKMEAAHAKMILINKALRRGDDAAILALGYSEKNLALLKAPDFAGRVGIPDYELTNSRAEIRRLKQRIADINDLYNSTPLNHECDDLKIYIDGGRVCVEFKCGKPNEAARNIMKREAFHWSRTACAWTRKATGNGIYAGECALKQLKELPSIY